MSQAACFRVGLGGSDWVTRTGRQGLPWDRCTVPLVTKLVAVSPVTKLVAVPPVAKLVPV